MKPPLSKFLIIVIVLSVIGVLWGYQDKGRTPFIANGIVVDIKCPKCLETKTYYLKPFVECTLEWSGAYRLQQVVCPNCDCRMTMAINSKMYFVMKSATWRKGEEFSCWDFLFT